MAKRGRVVLSAQMAITKCHEHGEDADFRCLDCNDYVCEYCIQQGHKDHKWSSLKLIAKEKRDGLSEKCRILQNEKLKHVLKKISELGNYTVEMESLSKQLEKDIINQRDETIAKIQSYSERLLKRLRKSHQEKLNSLAQKKQQLKDDKKYIEDTISFLKKDKDTMSDRNVIETDQYISERLSHLDLESLATSKYYAADRFNKTRITDSSVEAYFGTLVNGNPFNMTILNQFENKEVFRLWPLSEQCAWLSVRDKGTHENTLIQINNSGRITKTVKVELAFHSFIVLSNSNFLLASKNKCLVNLNVNGNIEANIQTDPLIPKGIAACLDGGILVSFRDNDRYDVDSSSKRLVKQMTLSGKTVKTYEYDDRLEKRLFNAPNRLTQNKNRDIHVCDRMSRGSGVLKTLGNNTLKWVYTGQKLEKDFDPADVQCDNSCNILVADYHNNVVHLINPEGIFITFVCSITANLSLPCSFGLYKSLLWVGSNNGLVSTFTYLDEKK